jgi:hypothetical protein
LSSWLIILSSGGPLKRVDASSSSRAAVTGTSRSTVGSRPKTSASFLPFDASLRRDTPASKALRLVTALADGSSRPSPVIRAAGPTRSIADIAASVLNRAVPGVRGLNRRATLESVRASCAARSDPAIAVQDRLSHPGRVLPVRLCTFATDANGPSADLNCNCAACARSLDSTARDKLQTRFNFFSSAW